MLDDEVYGFCKCRRLAVHTLASQRLELAVAVQACRFVHMSALQRLAVHTLASQRPGLAVAARTPPVSYMFAGR